ncbi:AP-1 complex subunit sigma-2-like, partial [Oncorhynchus clarkii lewisi]|uniref:AP-1 complex subunit sigma-2-like n=1 Tax=Oncorhynchus clarkii lewisi TaxID=490388 RepID=UPI0039B972DC
SEYASLYFCCGLEDQDNELLTLEVLQRYVELLDKYFGNVCELDIIFNFEKAYFILDEFLVGGEILETSKTAVGIATEEAETLQEFQSCPIAATPVRTRSRAMCPLKHDPSKLHCFLTQPHQCVGGNSVQLATVSACVLPARHTRVQ